MFDFKSCHSMILGKHFSLRVSETNVFSKRKGKPIKNLSHHMNFRFIFRTPKFLLSKDRSMVCVTFKSSKVFQMHLHCALRLGSIKAFTRISLIFSAIFYLEEAYLYSQELFSILERLGSLLLGMTKSVKLL